MTKVYLVRHCESVGNVMQVVQGSSDLDISELGAKQLEKLKERFEKIHLDAVIASPLMRAYKTAQAVVGDRDIEIVKDWQLREMDFGDIELKSREYFIEHYPEKYYIFRNRFAELDTPGGESAVQVYERVSDAFFKHLEKNRGKTFALVSHGGALRVLLAKLMYDDISGVNDMTFLANTAVCEIDIEDDGSVNVVSINDCSHLDKGFVTAVRV